MRNGDRVKISWGIRVLVCSLLANRALRGIPFACFGRVRNRRGQVSNRVPSFQLLARVQAGRGCKKEKFFFL